MFNQGLKTNIIITLVVLLASSMLLINFVVLVPARSLLLKSKVENGRLLMESIRSTVTDSYGETPVLNRPAKDGINRMLSEADYAGAVIMDRWKRLIYFKKNRFEWEEDLKKLTVSTLRTGKSETDYWGSIGGIFQRQHKYIVLSAPLVSDGENTGAVSFALHLGPVYQSLRRAQNAAFFYIVLNTIFFTLIGLHRLSKTTIRPVYRLLKRAEEYREVSEDYFLFDKNNDEFALLSRALNQMLRRIDDDREKLRDTVRSLETANEGRILAQREIVRAEKLASVGRLSAGIAHEIGNPIGIVIGYLELLKNDDLAPEEKKDFISRAESEIGRIKIIIRQLLDFSRTSLEDEFRTVSVHDTLREVAETIKYQPLTSSMAVSLSLSAKNDRVSASANQLRQVFLNLAINSADAIAEKKEAGRLDIQTFSRGSILEIRFEDDGPGIPEQHIGDVFDPFFTTKSPGKGTGLGLSVSFRIIEATGGNMEVISDKGKGTTFVIRLPAQGPESEDSAEKT